jgi:hypothetical protein
LTQDDTLVCKHRKQSIALAGSGSRVGQSLADAESFAKVDQHHVTGDEVRRPFDRTPLSRATFTSGQPEQGAACPQPIDELIGRRVAPAEVTLLVEGDPEELGVDAHDARSAA